MAFDLLRPDSSAGEPEWGDLFRQHAGDVRRLIGRRVPSGAPVDDLVQEAFYQAFRSRHRMDPARPVWPWLATVAHRVCITWWRRQRPQAEPWGAEEHVDPAGFPGSDEHLTTMDRSEQVSSALARVSPRHRFLLVAHTEGLSCERLAAFEGTSPKAVKSALERARTNFRRGLRGTGAKGCGLPGSVALAVKRWHARVHRSVPLVEGVGPWAGAVVALGVVATLSIAPVAIRTQSQSHAVAQTGPATAPSATTPASAVPSVNRGGIPRTEAATPSPPTVRPRTTTTESGSIAAAGIRTNAEVIRAPEGTSVGVQVRIEKPVIGGETTAGTSVRCDAGMVTAIECAVLRLLPEAES